MTGKYTRGNQATKEWIRGLLPHKSGITATKKSSNENTNIKTSNLLAIFIHFLNIREEPWANKKPLIIMTDHLSVYSIC